MIWKLLERNDQVIDKNGKEYVFLEYVMGQNRNWCHARPILNNDASSTILWVDELTTKEDWLNKNRKEVNNE